MTTMGSDASVGTEIDPSSREFYRRVLTTLDASGMPFLVGGAYAFERYTGIARHTKDFDVFIRPSDADRILQLLSGTGFETERTHPHFLGKVYDGESFIDVIFGSGNGVTEIDDAWFTHAVADEVLGIPVRLMPPEEMLWSKAFIMERERYDGADVAHLLRARADALDWSRVLDRFGAYWRVLLAHLVLFGFIYPAERSRIPERVMRDLLGRLGRELDAPPPEGTLCRGTVLSRAQYLVDIERWGYRDARLQPVGSLTPDEVAAWTAAIADEE